MPLVEPLFSINNTRANLSSRMAPFKWKIFMLRAEKRFADLISIQSLITVTGIKKRLKDSQGIQ